MDRGVVANPAKLRDFSKELQRSSEEYRQIANRLRKKLQSIGWEDSERQKFEADLNTTLKAIDRFAEQIRGQHVPSLERRAAALDAYLKR